MECDKNMALINQRYPAETLSNWREAISSARVKPCPFQVIECITDTFKAWGNTLTQNYDKTFAAALRRMIMSIDWQLIMSSTKTQTVEHRESYNGTYSSTVITKKEKKGRKTAGQVSKPTHLQVIEPENAYNGPTPVPAVKYKDLQVLKKFCKPETQDFFDKLPP